MNLSVTLRPLAIAAALAWSVATAIANPVGSYTVQGTNPGNKGSYVGTATVEKTGETYRVVWVIEGQRYVGTGIGNKDFMAVSYRSGNETGLALYGPQGDGWVGVWTYAGGQQMGSEVWKRK